MLVKLVYSISSLTSFKVP